MATDTDFPNDAQTGRLAGKDHVRLHLTGGRLAEPGRTRVAVCQRMSRLNPVAKALMNNLRFPFFFSCQYSLDVPLTPGLL
jgi:hypothetical protein